MYQCWPIQWFKWCISLCGQSTVIMMLMVIFLFYWRVFHWTRKRITQTKCRMRNGRTRKPVDSVSVASFLFVLAILIILMLQNKRLRTLFRWIREKNHVLWKLRCCRHRNTCLQMQQEQKNNGIHSIFIYNTLFRET